METSIGLTETLTGTEKSLSSNIISTVGCLQSVGQALSLSPSKSEDDLLGKLQLNQQI